MMQWLRRDDVVELLILVVTPLAIVGLGLWLAYGR